MYRRGGLRWLHAKRVGCPWHGLNLATYRIRGEYWCDFGAENFVSDVAPYPGIFLPWDE